MKTTIEVLFPVVTLTSGFVHDNGLGCTIWSDEVEVTHELRASVTFSGPCEDATCEPLERAHWIDSLGPEVQLGKRNEEWIGAEEQAIDRAAEKLLARLKEAS